MVKGITILGVVVGIIAGLVTLIGALQGQPDLLGQYAGKIGEILDKGVVLLDKCIEECFK